MKTLRFEDRIWDKSQQSWISRRLTISASDTYELPTTLDDEVILGLIQLTREDDFGSRSVFFSRYGLIRLLGWRNEGKGYKRLETSLLRWAPSTTTKRGLSVRSILSHTSPAGIRTPSDVTALSSSPSQSWFR